MSRHHYRCRRSAFRLQSLWLDRWRIFQRRTNSHARSDPFVAIYDYTDESGELLFQVCRKPDKAGFPQRRADGKGGWIWKTGDVRKVLYRLPELIEAVANERRILIVEGEKDVESLRKLNVPATCNPGGASGPGQQPKGKRNTASSCAMPISSSCRTTTSLAAPDLADTIVRMFCSHCQADTQILEPCTGWPDCLKGGDIRDWLVAGHSREERDRLD